MSSRVAKVKAEFVPVWNQKACLSCDPE